MRKVTTLVIASMLAFGSNAAFAVDTVATGGNWCHDGDSNGKMMKGGRGHHNMFDGLNLTEQQRQQMRDLMRQHRDTRSAIDFADRDAMHKLVATDKFDEAAVRAQAEKMSKLQVDRQVEMAKVRNQMYNLLTPEQKTKLNQLHTQRMSQMQQAPVTPQPASAQK
ncbi:cell-envelope stress modulator CpxP [Yersinia ruckeri]|uniref:P pilus assembly/Cpx signaling pathway, periplasmic inhibitor/zinc-resistance associated protein n=1 Tax=Yersinia ruckeri TaxID=29486 RepID=A0A085U3N7_YERRU|nr:cell-envelope stress modulator CpxP [Yersinia ruckeri]AKA38656.1 periplasmic stress adaptor protein CpxP [Yersinia ruckeri]ARZ02751.1 periplasmic stress adaptor protein CpxP [Yersinia ruckeri]EEP99422.1 Periplasmic repressor of cpx regulon by interaction with CpxA, rescue from transitory stresses [Yersinia ruckeri ATCC 29473]EKN3347495.1 cell-envelope stress modulator CpxP [Yersinia ruckeri]EKN3362853.1 cell-envelope stress modulator CpxP [Yersinia ruckeri]